MFWAESIALDTETDIVAWWTDARRSRKVEEELCLVAISCLGTLAATGLQESIFSLASYADPVHSSQDPKTLENRVLVAANKERLPNLNGAWTRTNVADSSLGKRKK